VPTLPDRIESKVRRQDDGCWIWTAETGRDGYGRTKADGRRVMAHRLVYTLLAGPIPAGLQLDHLCRVRSCVNPAHLEPVTSRENTLRSEGPAAKNHDKDECLNGHPFDSINTYVRPDGKGRHCKACHRARNRVWMASRGSKTTRKAA
jgi:hypothetical protein